MILTDWECTNCGRRIQIPLTGEEFESYQQLPDRPTCPLCKCTMQLRWIPFEQTITEHAERVWNDDRLARAGVKKVANLILKMLKES